MPHQPRLYGEMKQFLKDASLIKPGTLVAVAVSGGIDSVVLLDLLWRLGTEWKLKLVLFHVNHQLRGAESDGDELFVRSLATAYHLPIFVHRSDTRKGAVRKRISVQEHAREIRYAFFRKKAGVINAVALATAHNANDNAETVLLNMIRGTGIDGLAGIPPQREDGLIVRPLLQATRKQIFDYAESRKLFFREDSSNKKDSYSRNFLRHKVIPLIERKFSINFAETVIPMSRIQRSAADFISAQVDALFSKIVSQSESTVIINRLMLVRQSAYLQEMIIRRALLAIALEPTYPHIIGIARMLCAQRGDRFQCAHGWIVDHEGDRLVFRKKKSNAGFRYHLNKPGVLETEQLVFSMTQVETVPGKFKRGVEYVDGSKMKFPLVIRSWKSGDTFFPLGMNHRKKLSDFFIDQKISLAEKKNIPLLVNGKDIVWVAGYRIDERYRITDRTTCVFELRMNKK